MIVENAIFRKTIYIRKGEKMKVDVLVAEIGSTTTVVNAFKDLDTENPIFWAQGQAPTSVMDGDVRIGLQGAIDDLCKKMGIDKLEYDEMLATSSAFVKRLERCLGMFVPTTVVASIANSLTVSFKIE